MAKTLMESIAEDEEKLGKPTETPTEGEENDAIDTGEPETADARAGDETKPETEARSGDGGRRGKRSKPSGGASGETPRGESEASREDGETPSRDSGGTRKDARTPSEDGRSDVLAEKPPAPGDHAAWAKLRREKRELEAKLRTLEGKPPIAPEAKAPEAKKADAKPSEDAEPDKATAPEAWRDWKERQRDRELEEIRAERKTEREQQELTNTYKAAIGEFNQIRDDYIKQNPDYIPAFHHGFDTYAKSLKVIYPRATNQEITNHIDNELLKFASDCVAKGLNPAEELYDMAIERFGYAPNSKKDDPAKDDDGEEEKVSHETKSPAGVKPKEQPRVSLKTVSKNQRRAASPLMGPGQGGSVTLTKESVASMTNGELMNLGPEDWAQLERMGT